LFIFVNCSYQFGRTDFKHPVIVMPYALFLFVPSRVIKSIWREKRVAHVRVRNAYQVSIGKE